MPTKRSSSSALSSTSRSSLRSSGVLKRASHSLACMRQCWPTRTLSSADMKSNSLMFWNVRAMPIQATLCGLKPVMSAPSNSTTPSLGGSRPVIALKRVVLPAPLGPISAKTSPRRTSKLTSPTAVRPPNRLVTFWSLRMTPSLIRGPREIADFVGWSSGVPAKSQILWGGHPGSPRNRRFCGVVIRGPREIADFVGWSCDPLHLGHRSLVCPLCQLLLANTARNEPLRSEQHRHHQDQAEDDEVEPRHQVRQRSDGMRGEPDRGCQRACPVRQVGQELVLHEVDQHGPDDHARYVAHTAQGNHQQNRHGDQEGEVLRADQRELGAVIAVGEAA